MKKIRLILLLFFIVGCKGEQASDGATDLLSSVPGCESGGNGIPNNPHCNGSSTTTTTTTLPPSTSTSEISVNGAPTARDSHKVIWTGSKLIIWGGIEAGNADTGGGIYDPTLGTWTPMTRVGAPDSRAWNPAVFWTGSKMIVWGGLSPFTWYSNVGGLYDPSSDSWTLTSTLGAPTARYDALSVWTGSKLIIWGGAQDAGNGGGTFVNTGGQYDLSSDSWTSTTLINAPTARLQSCAVWTGSKMIVWGGVTTGAIVLNSGALYDPALNQWTAMSTVGAPSARAFHSCAWAGAKMIVWGGSSHGNAGSVGTGATFLNDGALYDPGTNTWSAISSVGAPSPRLNHFSVWTGSRYIILGGTLADETPTTSGAEYNPTANSWTSIPTGDVPVLNRMSYPSAAWTGTKMIMWGGLNSSGQLMNTGIVYTPQ